MYKKEIGRMIDKCDERRRVMILLLASNALHDLTQSLRVLLTSWADVSLGHFTIPRQVNRSSRSVKNRELDKKILYIELTDAKDHIFIWQWKEDGKTVNTNGIRKFFLDDIKQVYPNAYCLGYLNPLMTRLHL